jgi:hypothetical protein
VAASRSLAAPGPAAFGRATGGEVIESFHIDSGTSVRALRLADTGAVFVPFDLDEAYRNYVTEAWRDSAELRQLRACPGRQGPDR